MRAGVRARVSVRALAHRHHDLEHSRIIEARQAPDGRRGALPAVAPRPRARSRRPIRATSSRQPSMPVKPLRSTRLAARGCAAMPAHSDGATARRRRSVRLDGVDDHDRLHVEIGLPVLVHVVEVHRQTVSRDAAPSEPCSNSAEVVVAVVRTRARPTARCRAHLPR